MQLHALRIPAGWSVAQNHFYEVQPDDSALSDGRLDFPFLEDILQMSNVHLRLVLDLGWYPEGDPAGNFRLVLLRQPAPAPTARTPKPTIAIKRDHRANDGVVDLYRLDEQLAAEWQNPLLEYSSRDTYEIAARVNEILTQAANGEFGTW